MNALLFYRWILRHQKQLAIQTWFEMINISLLAKTACEN